jgi:hypothetical protein
VNSGFSEMIVVSFGRSRIAKAPRPPLGDWRTAKYSLEKSGGERKGEAEVEEEEKKVAVESGDEERFEEKEDAGG